MTTNEISTAGAAATARHVPAHRGLPGTQRTMSIVAFASVLVLAVAATPARATVTKLEAKCAKTLGKSASKLALFTFKKTGKCIEKDVKGPPMACPEPKDEEKFDKLADKLADKAMKKCGSVCSVSDNVTCLADSLCPPLNAASELCTAGGKGQPFDMGSLGFPGPYCESTLGHRIVTSDDLAECVNTLTKDTSQELLDVVYGTVDNSSALTRPAQKCLKKLGKGVEKIVKTIYKGVVKCRDAINKGKVLGNPSTCVDDDERLTAKLKKAEGKLAEFVFEKCKETNIQQLDLCGNGPGGTLTQQDALDCLTAAARELTDTRVIPAARQFGPISFIDAVYPPDAICGDNVVNQTPNPFMLLGEECDGTDDDACPGQCLPPGDVFECTCGNVPRMHFFADGLTADLDSGWTGTSHNQGVTDGAGFVTQVSNCDCDAFDGATCVGNSSDPVCDHVGRQLPTCSWDPGSATRCDAHGNGNSKDTDADCYICDDYSANPGDFCVTENDCNSQCYPQAGGAPTGPCSAQTDCEAFEVCRGRCDETQSCFVVPNGAPLPISSGGTAVCIENVFRQDVTGTQNLITGEHALDIRQFSIVHLGASNSVPCPVCGGFCEGGPLAGDVCSGSCSASGDACRFDDDCPMGESCTSASADCPGGSCNLSLVCGGGSPGALGAIAGRPCRVEASTTEFGTVSNDCPPTTQDISGGGLQINFLPQTSEAVMLPDVLPCSAPGFELFDCPCPDDGGRRTQPNLCGAACNAGAEAGTPCADFNGAGIGTFTTCAGGANAGRACDEDTDCPGSRCSHNPTHCVDTGDPTLERTPCTSNADCGLGTCQDACPSGRCLPLCEPTFADPQEGKCVAGKIYRCSGANDSFRVCTKAIAESGCSATCSISAAPCIPDLDPCGPGQGRCEGSCPMAQNCEAGEDTILGSAPGTKVDFPGAGVCIEQPRDCYVQPVSGEGGDTLNGLGDPTNVRSAAAYCVGATADTAINNVAGLGGPGRLRQTGINVVNYDSLP